MPASEVDSVSTMELEALMREYPDWKEQFPEVYEQQLNPPRYTKASRKDRQKVDRVMPTKQGPAPQSDYKATYYSKNSRPRSTKKPPPSPRDHNPPAMRFETNQRSEYTPKDLSVKAELFVQEENYENPGGPVQSKSQYGMDYPGHFILPDIHRVSAEDQKGTIKRTAGKFSSATTNKDHYKKWVPEKNIQFGELPSFTGSLLYPERDRYLESTNMAAFRGSAGTKPEMAKMADGNIKLEGNRDFDTTNRVAYKSFEDPKRAEMVNFKGEISVHKRAKFNGESQTRSDYKGYGGKPQRTRAVEPPNPSIDLRFDNYQDFNTEQRKQYKGIDISKHKVAEPFVPEDNTYRGPTEKFETQTSQKRDYRPIDVTGIYVPPKKAPQDHQRNANGPKMNDMTMNKHFFKKWDVQPRKNYGDFHEGHTYIPPADKFNTLSTTQETFVSPKQTAIPDSFKPEDTAIDSGGNHDFNTVYRVNFVEPSVSKYMNKQQKSVIFRELKKRQQQSQGGKGRNSEQELLTASN